MMFYPIYLEGSKPSPTIDVRAARNAEIQEVRLKYNALIETEEIPA